MLTRAGFGIVLSTIVFVVVQLAPLSVHAASGASKVNQLVKSSTRQFVQKTDTVWYTEAHGTSLKKYKVVVTVDDADKLAVIFVTVAAKASFQATPEFMNKLLRYNQSLDFVKVGLDDDGDVFVRIDASPRLLDAQEFETVIHQVSTSADWVHKGIGQFLTSK